MTALKDTIGLCYTQVVCMRCQLQYDRSENEKSRLLGASLFSKGTVRLSQAIKLTANN